MSVGNIHRYGAGPWRTDGEGKGGNNAYRSAEKTEPYLHTLSDWGGGLPHLYSHLHCCHPLPLLPPHLCTAAIPRLCTQLFDGGGPHQAVTIWHKPVRCVLQPAQGVWGGTSSLKSIGCPAACIGRGFGLDLRVNGVTSGTPSPVRVERGHAVQELAELGGLDQHAARYQGLCTWGAGGYNELLGRSTGMQQEISVRSRRLMPPVMPGCQGRAGLTRSQGGCGASLSASLTSSTA